MVQSSIPLSAVRATPASTHPRFGLTLHHTVTLQGCMCRVVLCHKSSFPPVQQKLRGCDEASSHTHSPYSTTSRERANVGLTGRASVASRKAPRRRLRGWAFNSRQGSLLLHEAWGQAGSSA